LDAGNEQEFHFARVGPILGESDKMARMQFLADLNAPTVLLTGLSALLVCVFLGLLWGSYGGRWPKESGRVLGFLLGVALICFLNAHDAYGPDADEPHIQRTGAINLFKPYTYSSGGRHSTTRHGLLMCVGPCDRNVPLMKFDAIVMASVSHRDLSSGYAVTYLGRKEQASIGNGYSITAHPVVEIDDTATGDRIFYIDTTRHWPRMILLAADALACIFTFVFCLIRSGSGTDVDDEGGGASFQSDRVHPMPDELTGLGLGVEDREKS
jgi:hypothetical protein